ncbi:hypothetical protein PGT21_001472 [Puccinia graminis f. sp. tritici]|uniref:Uncharacterized protein n=1 Tax=Puccinia graminis f. sp. tritici TaxID=56615 RepID=A0A5B0N9M5_PUCGR|nr:hypothetical protein PGT21_001472 [Puccinia graminis f. sp. tritici]KAA1128013.1 hypothetical protein PGTUg99_009768 [Puccinia graminis f. sp. tritici]
MSSQLAHTSPALQCQLEHKGIVHVATFNHGAQYVLTGGQDRTIRLWNAKTGNFIKDYSGHGYEILGIAVSPNNSFLGSVGGDRSVFYWDVSTGTILRRFSGHTGVINACAFNFDGNLLISGSFDASVRVWDIKSQQRHPIQIFQDAKDSITSIIVSGSEFITGSVDGYVRSYDIRMGQMMEDYFEDPVTSIHLLKDSKTMAVSTLNSTIRLMDRERGEMLQKFTGHRALNYRSRISMSYDEAQVLAGDEDGLLWAWDLESGKKNAGMSFEAHQKHVTWVECHPKTNCFITAAADGLTRLWNLGK